MTTASEPRPTSAAAIDVARVVIPLDTSPASERALGVAEWLGTSLGAPLEVVHVASRQHDDMSTQADLTALANGHGAKCTVLSEDHVADALAAYIVAGDPALVCLATHGRDRSSAIIGSTAASLVDLLHEPTVLVGPKAENAVPELSAPIVVAVGGQAEDEDLLQLAAQWATQLARPLVVVTVVEPAPDTLRGDQLPSRAHGPADPAAYLATLMAPLQAAGIAVSAEVIDDAVSIGAGLLGWLHRAPAAVLVVGAHHRRRLGRLLHGATAAHVAHVAPCPVLVVELDWRR